VRRQGAAVHELARVGELAGLPGETLTRLADRMERHELHPGDRFDASGRFAVVVAGLIGGPTGLLRPGDAFTNEVVATTPATVVSCERAAYAEVVGGR
jgi:hypothetical protein